MKFIHRLGYYLGGFALGLILLAYFFNGKKTSCAYGPNARTIKNINLKEQKYAPQALEYIHSSSLDTIQVNKIMKYGEIDFSNSQTELDSCKIYLIKGKNELESVQIHVENCTETATILKVEKITD